MMSLTARRLLMALWVPAASAVAQGPMPFRGEAHEMLVPAAQETPLPERRNDLYAEIGGLGFATVNYERQLARNAGLRVAGGVLFDPEFVVMPTLTFGGRRHRFSAGVGLLAVWTDGAPEVEPTGQIAYRRQGDSGFVFRASVGVLRGVGDLVPGVVFMPGISVGWSF
jgi:hypothetical protein